MPASVASDPPTPRPLALQGAHRGDQDPFAPGAVEQWDERLFGPLSTDPAKRLGRRDAGAVVSLVERSGQTGDRAFVSQPAKRLDGRDACRKACVPGESQMLLDATNERAGVVEGEYRPCRVMSNLEVSVL